jgi:hypothetical protein
MIHHSVEPSERMRYIFDAHVSQYGDPDIQFEFQKGASNIFNRLDVFLWEPTGQIPMTTFSTAGMADLEMKGVSHRCEIHWTIRGLLTEKEEADCAQFLAVLAEYPFLKNAPLDHWHIISRVAIPAFPKCSHILFHPTFVKEGWDKIEFKGQTIKILNMVPITDEENKIAVNSGVDTLLDRLFSSQTDIFSDRK